MSQIEIKLNVNGKDKKIKTQEDKPLLFVIRDEFNLTGTKLGCGLEQCGSCAVLVDGKKVLSCNRIASEFEGKKIITIEGLKNENKLNDVQQSFKEHNAAQCGYCTSGIIISLTELFNNTDKPSKNEIIESLKGQLCRCGSHFSVLKAVDKIINK